MSLTAVSTEQSVVGKSSFPIRDRCMNKSIFQHKAKEERKKNLLKMQKCHIS